MTDTLSIIDQKILQLKHKKEKIQTQQAALFLKEAQKILGAEFSIELALTILSHSWKNASHKQKEEWNNATLHFQKPTQRTRKTDYQAAAENP